MLAIVARRVGDFSLAEDAVQQALLAAALQWPEQGIPDQPRAWLIGVANRRVADQRRAELARRRREVVVVMQAQAQVAAPDSRELGGDESERDDTLLLLFMCCHPALTRTSAIALTLRAVGGLTTAEIANAFLVPEATMAQRISRAKQLIAKSGAQFEMPTAHDRTQRLGAVLHVLYLIYNEGYASSVGADLQRADLSREAIRLTRMVRGVLPNEGEVAGLLALMLLTDARRNARSGPQGELIPLDEQDRSAWDREAIDEGVALVTEAMSRSRGAVGPYQVQAAIAALHDEAPSTKATDWPQILALYEVLDRMSRNPMVALNRAIAAAMVHGPEVGLDQLEALDDDAALANHYRLAAVRAHLFELAGDAAAALIHYRAAASRTASLPERNYLLMKAARLQALEREL